MQPARFKLHAEERTCSPVQRSNFRGQAREEPRQTISPKIPKVQIRKDRGRGTQVAVLPRMGRAINPGVLSSLALAPAC